MKAKVYTIGLTYLLCMAGIAFAENVENQSPRDVGFRLGETGIRARFFVGLGASDGGDTLVEGEVVYVDEDGKPVRTRDFKIKAGGRAHLHAGMLFQRPPWPYEVKATLGFFADSESADNANISFQRLAMEIIGFYKHGNWRFGGGLSAHIAPELSIEDRRGNKATIDMDTTVGPLATVAYQWNHWRAGIRAMLITYRGSDLEKSIDGSNFGGFVGWAF